LLADESLTGHCSLLLGGSVTRWLAVRRYRRCA
jgi:hypothetical protein